MGKVCQLFFPTDGAVWRHLGKEVYIRKEERHLDDWHNKEDRWGHEEDEECCGDGIGFARGMSYDTVKLMNEAALRREEEEAAAQIDNQKLRLRREGKASLQNEESG